jgi:hypothetical protein
VFDGLPREGSPESGESGRGKNKQGVSGFISADVMSRVTAGSRSSGSGAEAGDVPDTVESLREILKVVTRNVP